MESLYKFVNDMMYVVDKIIFLVDEIIIKIHLKLNIIIILINKIVKLSIILN